ncbi:hypothetical protein [Nucisporomicrobium flavum]|uniref:hypothetical protein n=1 Tax=Nucisporomicrobium flavum TaxID=2785915 RepID=UPI0018F2E13B|nr:hypothetical protein [Nucisporomicrobium flavum]
MGDAEQDWRAPGGLLWESWLLVCVISGDRVMTGQVIVKRLMDGRWCVQTIEAPRRLHLRHFVTFDDTEHAGRALRDLYEQGQTAGTWSESRFGHQSILAMTADSKPHW